MAVLEELPRAVLDTNVLIRAAMNPHGFASYLTDQPDGKLFQSITSQAQLHEYLSVIRRKQFRKTTTSARRHDLYVEYAARSTIVDDNFMAWPCIRDAKDDYIVEIAKRGNACIVTGDSDFFAADLPPGIEVYSAGWFARHILNLDVDAMFPKGSRSAEAIPVAESALSIA